MASSWLRRCATPTARTCSATAPCPTVIEYSGYDTAGPTDPIPPLLDAALGVPCTNCGNPNLLPDSATDVGAVLARISGFATVSLQMRGTGCSGGAFDLFGYPSDYDAYDAIEIVAHQAWVANHKVGMVGISYSGLSQFPAAGTDPPGLAAIAPMSPTDDLFSTGYPGGIYNDGFAASWIGARIDDAMPAATYSDGTLVQLARRPRSPTSASRGPTTRSTRNWPRRTGPRRPASPTRRSTSSPQDLASLVGPQVVAPGTGSGRDPSLFDRRSMVDWAIHITVPVFLSGALEDEQTGPQWPALINAIPKTTPVFANMVNGGHIDSTDPQTISRWLEFLDVYVADKVPTAAQLSSTPSSSTSSPRPPRRSRHKHRCPRLRFTTDPNVTAARADFAAQTPLVHVLFDSGAGKRRSGRHRVHLQRGLLLLAPGGHRDEALLRSRRVVAVLACLPERQPPPSASIPVGRPATSLPAGANAWAADPPWDWTPVPAADGIAFQTAPFTTATTIVGPATLNLWVKAAVPVEDFQATVTEVRPSAGQEEYVTSGFLRSSNQVDNPDSTALFTDPTYLASGGSEPVARLITPWCRIPIDAIAHTFRPGTELRVVISAPGGDRPEWAFDTLDNGQQAIVGLGGLTPSSFVVNEVPGVAATTTLPACGSLRGEPCRAYQAESN